MFTGIVEGTGTVISAEFVGDGRQFCVSAPKIFDGISVGDSIAVNGCCQTVESFDEKSFIFFSVPETLRITNLAFLKVGDRVNLERAMRLDARLGGHLVQGHIEGMAEIARIERSATHVDIKVRYRSPFLVPKGSVTLDGISLTVHNIEDDIFSVQIIPETIARTNIGDWSSGRKVNIETDFMVKTIDHLLRYYHQERSI